MNQLIDGSKPQTVMLLVNGSKLYVSLYGLYPKSYIMFLGIVK